MKTIKKLFLGMAASLLLAGSVLAAGYPDRPVRLVVPFPAGSSTDAVGRAVAQMLGKSYDQPFVVDNKPGALATIGAAEVAKAKPDGYTLFLGTSTSQAAAPALFKKLPYDPERSFVPVGRVAAVAFVVAVRSELPVHSIDELVAFGKKKSPRSLTWGYANSANQVAGAALVRHGQFEAVDVPYKGVSQMVIDMIGGSIDFTIADMTNLLPQIKAGKLRALAVTSAKELPELPGVPPLSNTMKGFQLLGWYGLFAPAGTPDAVVNDLSQRLQKGLEDPETKKEIASFGVMTFPGSGAELKSYVTSETVKWAELVKGAGIQPE